MKISTWMHIEHEMAMKNQRWIVDGDDGSMSPFYFSHTHSSPTGKEHWNDGWMMENWIEWWRNSNEWVKMMQAALELASTRHQ